MIVLIRIDDHRPVRWQSQSELNPRLSSNEGHFKKEQADTAAKEIDLYSASFNKFELNLSLASHFVGEGGKYSSLGNNIIIYYARLTNTYAEGG